MCDDSHIGIFDMHFTRLWIRVINQPVCGHILASMTHSRKNFVYIFGKNYCFFVIFAIEFLTFAKSKLVHFRAVVSVHLSLWNYILYYSHYLGNFGGQRYNCNLEWYIVVFILFRFLYVFNVHLKFIYYKKICCFYKNYWII